jgi:D-alanyl-D-alanine-carboxypeptidase/D-alanyl-D-alanine-endopeptidase
MTPALRQLARVWAVGLGLWVLTALTPAAQAQPLNQDPRIAQALQQLFRTSRAPAMVIAVVRGEERHVEGFGRVRPGSLLPPDGETLVRLGSISKLFAGEAAAALQQEGRLRLTDPLSRFAPAGIDASQAPPVTLVQLATHTSALPRLSGLPAQAGAAEASAARWRWFARLRGPAPGRRAVYSNIAFDLLSDAVASAAREPYAQALARRVTGPLRMGDTTPTPNARQCARLMDGGLAGEWRRCRDMAFMAGAGGLYSTADDMALWMRHQLGIGQQPRTPWLPASQAIYVRPGQLASTEGLDRAGPAAGIGLGWIELAPTVQHPRLLEKTGGGWGFMTYVAIAPGRRAGVFVAMASRDVATMPAVAAQVNALVGRLSGVAQPSGTRPAPGRR